MCRRAISSIHIVTLVTAGITAGVGGGGFGVDQPTLRQQMAVSS